MTNNVPTLEISWYIVVLVCVAMYMLVKAVESVQATKDPDNIGQGYIGQAVVFGVAAITLLFAAKEMLL